MADNKQIKTPLKMTVINGFIIIKDVQGRDILVDWDVNSDESAGIRIDTEGEIAIWTDIVNRVNAYDADQAEIKRLREALEKAINMLNNIECPQDCVNGAIQISEDEVQQCQWCDELNQISKAL